MSGPILPPTLHRGPDCQVQIRNGRPAIADRNPYTRAVFVTAAVVVLTMATDAPTLARALAVILCAFCNSLYLTEKL